jgi:hypothetical protein
MAGTEHNTLDRIPLDPACVDAPLSASARAAFFRATCVVVAHAARVSQGLAGYVDERGARIEHVEVDTLVDEGKKLIIM